MCQLKYLSVIILSLQVPTYTFADTNVTEDAQLALALLYDEIESATELISEAADLWSIYSTSNSEIVNQQMKIDKQNLKLLVNNLTIFSDYLTDAQECLSSLNIYFDTENYVVASDDTVISSEGVIFRNLLSLANAEVKNIAKQFDDLDKEFSTHCVQNRTHCKGVSLAVVDQVSRLIATVKRIPYELISEVHLLDYRLSMRGVIMHSIMMNEYNKAIQNATICLASKFELYRKEEFRSPKYVKESIMNSFYDMLNVVISTSFSSLHILEQYLWYILKQCELDYLITMNNIRNATFKANQTVNSLLNTAKDFNVTTLNCTTPDIVSVIDRSTSRVLSEYTLLLNATIRRYNDGVSNMERFSTEIESVGLQIEDCSNDTSCDYLAEKIAAKTVDIPVRLRSSANSTAVLLHQTVMDVRESESKIIRDILGQFEAALLNLKDCVRNSLY